jgi:hypothetical protein
MGKVIIAICLTMTVNASVCYAEDYDNPLQSLDFVYSQDAIQDAVKAGDESRQKRIEQAFANATGEGLRQGLCPYVANLWLGNDLDATNATLLELFTTKDTALQEKYRLNDPWCLAVNQQMYHMYYAFGSKGTDYPGRLYPETEKAMLDFLWNRLQYKNDIHLARKSTWWMIGSENHDLVAKVSSLISSQIFMNEPAFKDRVYPDLGTGGGQAYWFHHMYGKDRLKGPNGRANEKDGKEYNAEDHYHAWLKYFDEYFSERAKKGFFLEVASPGYMAVSVSYLTDLYDLCDDDRLTAKAEMFLDLVWADWAQDQLNGLRGGAKTRASGHNRGDRWSDSMYRMARYYFGGEGDSQTHFFTQLLSDYELKPIIWHIALDRDGLGEFAFISRKPGEEENVWPRPLGTERTMVCDTESRFVRYSWVTPDYILGCQMDHPASVHSHLSVQARWQGMTFKGQDGPRVFPVSLITGDKGEKRTTGFKKVENDGKWSSQLTAYCRTIQDGNVMLAQQARRWFQMNPDWFPAKVVADQEYGVSFSKILDRVEEKEGWIFIEHGDAYLAVRPVIGEYHKGWTILKDDSTPGPTSQVLEDSYDWNDDRTLIRLKDNYAGIIFEASRRANHPTLEEFMADILDNPLILDKTVVPGWHVLRYRGCGEDAKEMYFNLANNEMSMVDGQRIDYAPSMLFDSPYIKSEYKSGVITVTKDDLEMVLDFNQ